MNIQPYPIPSEPVVFEEEIKKSLFITLLAHTCGAEAAKTFIDEVRKEHPAARHHCWGFVAGRPEDSMQWGFSDDGEPSGTAGKPILAQLSGSGIGEITAVVVRYSGGIKLGTGGLVKAYGGGVQSALKMVQTIEKKITTHLKLRLDYSFISLVQSLISQYDAVEVSSEFSEQIEMVVEIEQLVSAQFTQALINKTGAKVQASELKDN